MATIQGVYVALFGRPADPIGLAYWKGVTNDGADLSLIGDLAQSQEYKDRFAGQSNAQIVNSIYLSLFNRDSDAAGLAFFVNGLNNGTFNINDVAIRILDAAQGSDKTTVDTKVAAADLYTASLDTGAEIAQYSGNDAAAVGREFLAPVTTTVPDQAAVDAAIEKLFDTEGPTGVTLTTNADVVTGNQINAPLITLSGVEAAESLNTFDSITGAGDDATLTAVLRGSQGVVAPTIAGVENIALTAIDAGLAVVLDLRNATGVNNISNEFSSDDIEVRNIAFVEGFELGVSDTAQDSNFVFTEGSTTGENDVLGITLSDVDGFVGVTANGPEGIETVNLVSNGTTNDIGFGVDGLTTLNISGAADLGIAQAIGASTIDASELTGDLGIDLLEGLAEADVTLTGGAGDDRVYAGTSLTSADTLDGGEGDDVLILTNTAAGDFVDSEDDGDINAVNFETLALEVGGNSALDYAAFSAEADFTEITVEAIDADNAGDDEVDFDLTNLRSVSSIQFRSDNNVDINGNLISTDDFGTVNVVYAEDEEVSSASLRFSNRGFDTFGVDALNVAVDGDFDDDELTTLNLQVDSIAGANENIVIGALTTDTVETINITGSANLTIGAALNEAVEEVNAAGATGDLVITLGNVVTPALEGARTVTTGSGDDFITGADQDDTIDAGAGNDVIRGGAGNNTLTGGAGDDVFDLKSSAAGGVDVITDFTAGENEDVLDIVSAEATGVGGGAGDVVFAFVDTNTAIAAASDTNVVAVDSNLVLISETASQTELAGLFDGGALDAVDANFAATDTLYFAFQTSGGNVNIYQYTDEGTTGGITVGEDAAVGQTSFTLVARLEDVNVGDLDASNFSWDIV